MSDVRCDVIIYDFNCKLDGKTVVLYGASETGIEIYNQLHTMHSCTISMAIDQNADHTNWDLCPCVSPKDFFSRTYAYDYIIVCSSSNVGKCNIRKFLIEQNVPNEIIIDYSFSDTLCVQGQRFYVTHRAIDFVSCLYELHKITMNDIECFRLCVKWLRNYWTKLDEKEHGIVKKSMALNFWEHADVLCRIASGIFLFEDRTLTAEQVKTLISYAMKVENKEYQYNMAVYIGWMEHRQASVVYRTFGEDRKKLWSCIMEDYFPEMMNGSRTDSFVSDNNRVALLVNYLMGEQESAGIWYRGYAKGLSQAGKQVRIFVLMYHQMGVGDLSVHGKHAYETSMLQANWNQSYLGNDIEVTYIYEETAKEMLLKVDKLLTVYRPSCVIDGTDEICPISWLLYKKYPVFYLANNEHSTANWFDKTQLLNLQDNDLYCDKVVKLPWVKPSQMRKVLYSKQEYFGLSERSFLVVSVGVRLSDEIDAVLMEHMQRIMLRYQDIHWVLVGTSRDGIWSSSRYQAVADRIHIISYEKHLASLYAICDVFLHPNRAGGGYSLALAMEQGLAIAIMKQSQNYAAGMWAKDVYAVEGGYGALVDHIAFLYQNPNQCALYKEQSQVAYEAWPSYQESADALSNILDEMIKERCESTYDTV